MLQLALLFLSCFGHHAVCVGSTWPLVVQLALPLVAQNLVRLLDRLEGLLVTTLVGVVLGRHALVRLPDLVRRGVLLDSECLVILAVLHRPAPPTAPRHAPRHAATKSILKARRQTAEEHGWKVGCYGAWSC